MSKLREAYGELERRLSSNKTPPTRILVIRYKNIKRINDGINRYINYRRRKT